MRPLPWFHWVALSSAAWHAQHLSSYEAVGLLVSVSGASPCSLGERAARTAQL